MEGYPWGEGMGKLREKVLGLKSIIGRQVNVKNSIGNGEAKELICTTHGHQLRWGNAGGRGVQGREE